MRVDPNYIASVICGVTHEDSTRYRLQILRQALLTESDRFVSEYFSMVTFAAKVTRPI